MGLCGSLRCSACGMVTAPARCSVQARTLWIGCGHMAAFRAHLPHGPWAVVAGASEGLGAAWVEALARRGLHVLAVARRPEPLERMAQRVAAKHQVDVRTLAADL